MPVHAINELLILPLDYLIIQPVNVIHGRTADTAEPRILAATSTFSKLFNHQQQ